ncbi:hypothetical protein [Nocardioides dilutus]
MFVQVIQGEVADTEKARQRLESWVSELGPSAGGWLGSTGGVTDDGTLVLLARFESEDAARANSERPEQGEWWAETEKVFEGQPSFKDSLTVLSDCPGDPDTAGFVQVMQGQMSDPDRAAQMFGEDLDFSDYRPDILGRLLATHEGGAWTMAIYFTSEEDARAGEQKEPPPEMAQRMAELQELSVGPPTFHDLRDPWLHSPA